MAIVEFRFDLKKAYTSGRVERTIFVHCCGHIESEL